MRGYFWELVLQARMMESRFWDSIKAVSVAKPGYLQVTDSMRCIILLALTTLVASERVSIKLIGGM